MTTIPVARSRLQSWNGRLLGWLILLAAGVGISLSGCGSDPSSAVSTFPLPGSRVAAPQTQIEFRGVSLGQLGQVEVTGSRTGPHAGRLMGDSDGRGASFLPVKPFKPGEVVTVRTKRHLPGLRRRSWHFGVADPAGPIPNGPLPPARRLPGDVLTFRSRPDLQPPAVEIVRRSARAASGDVFVTPQQGPLQNGPMIIDAAGELRYALDSLVMNARRTA